MQISPISFTRVLRTNAPLSIADVAAGVTMGHTTSRNERKALKDLREIFPDWQKGVVACKLNNKNYMLSGEHARRATFLEEDRIRMINAGKANRPDTAEITENYEDARYEDLMRCIVYENLEDDVVLDIDYNKSTGGLIKVELEEA